MSPLGAERLEGLIADPLHDGNPGLRCPFGERDFMRLAAVLDGMEDKRDPARIFTPARSKRATIQQALPRDRPSRSAGAVSRI